MVVKRVADENFSVKSIKPLVSTKTEMYQLKYTCSDLSKTQIGHMKHIASYITTLGHIYLYRMILLLSARFSPNEARICYTDTDSTFVDVTAGFDRIQLQLIEETFEDTQGPCLDLETMSGMKQKI